MTRTRQHFAVWLAVALALALFTAPWADGQCVTWQSCCPGSACPAPQSCPPRQASPRPQPDGEFTRPAPQFQPLPPPPPPATPELPQQPAVDWEALQQQQRDALAEQQKTTAELHTLVVAIQNQKQCDCQPPNLQPVLDAIADVKAAQQPPQPPPPPPTETHVVVVADHNAPYWERLAQTLADTRKTYSGVQETTLPPFAVGVHPQAVVYRNSVPVRVVKGQYEVENLLSRLARGEPI